MRSRTIATVVPTAPRGAGPLTRPATGDGPERGPVAQFIRRRFPRRDSLSSYFRVTCASRRATVGRRVCPSDAVGFGARLMRK